MGPGTAVYGRRCGTWNIPDWNVVVVQHYNRMQSVALPGYPL